VSGGMPRDDRYGLAFVQNHTVLGSLRIVAVGCLFVFFIPALAFLLEPAPDPACGLPDLGDDSGTSPCDRSRPGRFTAYS